MKKKIENIQDEHWWAKKKNNQNGGWLSASGQNID